MGSRADFHLTDLPLTDLHSHPIPGLDDGPATFEESLALLEHAFREGTRRLVATPHCHHGQFELDPTTIRRAFDRWRAELSALAEHDDRPFLHQLELVAGAENMLGPELLEEAEAGKAMTLGRGRFLLVELPAYLPPASARAGFSRLSAAGYLPLLAHAERYGELVKDRDRLWTLERTGVRLQINAGNLLRRDGTGRLAHRLLKSGLVLAVASDGHHAERRPPDLLATRLELERRYGRARARYWLSEAPAAIALGETLPEPPPPPGKSRWWRFWEG